ncbi:MULTISPECIES: GyrI-like domain-containing protein [unclassified Pseudoalteromonas]|uniref:GyrI-like domain-containing protein n=1 Tax=unclassified Pseudoalteromonas TaxID=194690 RepID=UPI002096D6A1|nr:GyrI-like domain-containing protein [Pseudoalteromonas sp. XMcav2-N]MCO7189074.1 GyrI-like domain-containing protein [Pseudoalteromonas sp. XMcav2-N]
MEVKTLTSRQFVGISTRTNNHHEQTETDGKIAQLWQSFYHNYASLIEDNTTLYGIYSHYESDQHGDYNITVACDAPGLSERVDNDNALQIYRFSGGRYLSFAAQGEMPQTAIRLWELVWRYFEQSDCPYQRAFGQDIEIYHQSNEVEIAISIL